MGEHDAVQLTIDSSQPADDLSTLATWLRGERRLQGHVRLGHREPGDRELGASFGFVSVALGSGGLITVLASSLTAWLQSRRTRTRVRITITRPDRTLEIETSDADKAEALIRGFLGEADGE